MNELNLIWQTGNPDETNFEFEYITEKLFSGFTQNRYFDEKKYETVLNNSLIIYSCNQPKVSDEFLNYLKKYKENNFKFYLLHLSNENLNHDFSYYTESTHTFRNYYDSKIDLSNVTFIPLGVKSGFINKMNDQKILNEKIYDFTFIGQPKADRYELISILERFEKIFIHKTERWNCPTSLSQNECIEIYKKTKFVPCPEGFAHPDSFRIMEVLESGSIPILKNYRNLEYFDKVWGFSPIPVVYGWNELDKFLQMTDLEYSNLYNTVFNWYHTTWDKFSEKLNQIIDV